MAHCGMILFSLTRRADIVLYCYAVVCPVKASAGQTSLSIPTSLAEVPAAASASLAEVQELDEKELDELLRELNVGVIARHRILKEHSGVALEGR